MELVDVAGAKTMELQALRAQKRVVALYGNFQQVKESLQSALPFRRRFEQSGVLILPVCSSLEGADEATCNERNRASHGPKWIEHGLNMI